MLKTFFKNSNLDDSVIFLAIFPSKTNLKLPNISLTLKMVKKVITNFDLSKARGPDCISVVALKRCAPELLYIGERSTARLVFFLLLVKSWINGIVDQLDRLLSKHFSLQPFLRKDSVSLLFAYFSYSLGWPYGKHRKEKCFKFSSVDCGKCIFHGFFLEF